MYQPYFTNQQVIQVNGENGAKAYQMPPNSSTLLLDETAPIVWLVRTDGAGYKSLTPYKIEPYQQEPELDMKQLNDRISKLEEMVRNEKSNNYGSKPKQPKPEQHD